MPGWLQGFADNQPVTQAVDAVRALLLGNPVGNHVWVTFLWCAGLMVVLVPLAVSKYRHSVSG
jgi:ABC-type multidrug transport system permease subunit